MDIETVVYKKLARAAAERRISDENIRTIARQISAFGPQIKRLDVCAYGICIDYFIKPGEWVTVLPDLVNIGVRVGKIEIFPLGIIDPDVVHIRIEHELGPGF